MWRVEDGKIKQLASLAKTPGYKTCNSYQKYKYIDYNNSKKNGLKWLLPMPGIAFICVNNPLGFKTLGGFKPPAESTKSPRRVCTFLGFGDIPEIFYSSPVFSRPFWEQVRQTAHGGQAPEIQVVGQEFVLVASSETLCFSVLFARDLFLISSYQRGKDRNLK